MKIQGLYIMSMGTNTILPFAGTIYSDIQKIIDATFSGCTQKDLDRLCLTGYYVNNNLFVTAEETMGCSLRFNIGGKGLPDGKYKLNVLCGSSKDNPNKEEEIKTLYEVVFFDRLKTKTKCFEDLYSALAYCDGHESGDIDGYITDIE